MARRNSRTVPSIQPAEKSFYFSLASGAKSFYIDLAQCLSFVNRRLYAQGKKYYIESIEMIASGGGTLTCSTIPDTWATANAWVKSKALWKEMNSKVLSDNPSTQGKWADFKVFMDIAHATGSHDASGSSLNMKPESGNPYTGTGTEVEDGEWNYSDFVMPQHSVDGSGNPLAADQFTGHMLGVDVAGAGSPDLIRSGGIIHAYADTRARVQAEPDVPSDMSTSWFTLLTDDGSQEPELADVIEAENDLPPYAQENYPGGDSNYNGGVVQSVVSVPAATVGMPNGIARGFCAPLGLIKVDWQLASTGVLKLNVMPGTYKGVMATSVRQ